LLALDTIYCFHKTGHQPLLQIHGGLFSAVKFGGKQQLQLLLQVTSHTCNLLLAFC
jgi:hypothetical protein